jgi:hypothetical protein
MSRLCESWYATFLQTLQRHEAARPLREAAAAGRLNAWTQALTGVVVDVCGEMGWQTAAKWHRLEILPEARKEYLTLDAMAFAPASVAWPFPVAVFELENSRQDDKVAYSLWKLLCVRAGLRVLFCYRRDARAGSALVRQLEGAVVGSLPIQERVDLAGETLLIVGSRAEEAAFPYGFFKDWVLDKNTGEFARS